MLDKTHSTESIDISKMCDDLLNTMARDNIKFAACFLLGVSVTLTAMWVIG